MKEETYNDIYTEELAEGAILHGTDYIGFKEDYLILHCLIRKYKPKTFFEIGTNIGTGTKIIKNAIGYGIVYSLDLPAELGCLSQQYNEKVGSLCDLPYVQLLANSLEFDYKKVYPIEGWFIDGEHDYTHVFHESKEAFASGAKIIIWHDSDENEVLRAILDAVSDEYEVIRVTDTRISYAIKK